MAAAGPARFAVRLLAGGLLLMGSGLLGTVKTELDFAE